MIAAEIKAARKRKKLKQENHKDDGGSNSGPLGEVALTIALVADGVSAMRRLTHPMAMHVAVAAPSCQKMNLTKLPTTMSAFIA